MKFLLVMILFMLAEINPARAQNKETGGVSSALTSLIELSKSKSYNEAAGLIAYSGEDKERNRKAPLNPSVKEELNQVKRICKKIAAFVELSSNYSIKNTSSKIENGKEIFEVLVEFKSGSQILTSEFRFVNTPSGLLLIDMS